MEDKEILIKSMAIAVRKGYDLGEQFFTETPTEFYLVQDMDLYFSLVFDHEFAKAFWGEEIKDFEHCSDTDGNVNCPLASWKGNLQQMVLEDDPIQYLKQFLDV